MVEGVWQKLMFGCRREFVQGFLFTVQGSVVSFLMGVRCRPEDQGVSVQCVAGIKKPSC